MKRGISVLALALAFVLAPATQAAIRHGHDRTVNGMLKSVDPGGKHITISVLNLKTNELKDHKIKINSNTKVLLNGQSADVSSLPIGQSLTINVQHGVAIQIQAVSH